MLIFLFHPQRISDKSSTFLNMIQTLKSESITDFTYILNLQWFESTDNDSYFVQLTCFQVYLENDVKNNPILIRSDYNYVPCDFVMYTKNMKVFSKGTLDTFYINVFFIILLKTYCNNVT